MNKQLFFLSLLLITSLGLQAKVNNYVLSSAEPLTIALPKKFQDKNVVQLRTFLRQYDNWSCGLRSIFHALAIEKAIQTPDKFEVALKEALRDSQVLHKLDRAYGKNEGLNTEVTKKLAQQFGIGNKLISLVIREDSILSVGTVRYQYPDTPEIAFAKKLQQEMDYLVNLAQKAPQAVYFITESEPQHAVLFALVNLPNRPAKLYIIDSNNSGMSSGREKFVEFFTPYLNKLNNNKHLKDVSKVSPAIVSQLPKVLKNYKMVQAKKHNKQRSNRTNKHRRTKKVQKQNRQAKKSTTNLNPALLHIWQLSREGKLKTTRPFRAPIRIQRPQSSCCRTQCPVQKQDHPIQKQVQPNAAPCPWMQAIADKYGTSCPLRK